MIVSAAKVSEVIVERADDETLGVLLGNDGASLSRHAHEIAVDRAEANPALHEAVVNRRHLPVDLLNDMYFVVETKLRTKILERNAAVDPEALEAALAAGRNRVATLDGALPADYEAAERDVRSMVARKALTPKALASMLRNRESTRFMVALAELAGIDFHTARVILEKRELDALAIVCKAAEFDRSLFLTFAVLVLDRDADPMGRAKKYGDLYTELPKESAQRTAALLAHAPPRPRRWPRRLRPLTEPSAPQASTRSPPRSARRNKAKVTKTSEFLCVLRAFFVPSW